jgi:hypothetical protein
MNVYPKGPLMATVALNVRGTGTGTVQVAVVNQPDTALHDNTEKTCLLINMAIAHDSNFKTKESENPSKYKDLWIEIIRMRRVRMKIVPVIIGALGAINKALHQKLQLFQGHRSPL